MGRYTGPKTRINRRFGMALFPANKAFERKPYVPGQHGPRLRRKATPFSIGLLEKQKLRYYYGLLEKQFRKIFETVKSKPGVTGDNFLMMLESRLDNVVYLLGFTKTRRGSRQFVVHGHIFVNGIKTDRPSYQCQPGDIIEVRNRVSSKQVATRNLDVSQYRTPPAWLRLERESYKGFVDRLPASEELDKTINMQLIVEFYSR